MNTYLDSIGWWLADFHLLGGALIAAVLLVLVLVGQPAKRMAVANSALLAIAALAVLCTLPGWSVIHLLRERGATMEIVVPAGADPPLPLPSLRLTPTEHAGRAQPTLPPRIKQPPQPLLEMLADELSPWPGRLVSIDLTGSTAVILWLAAGALTARRIRRTAAPAGEELRDLLGRVVGGRTAPELLVSDSVPTAVAMGLNRRAIILPAALPGELCNLAPGPHGRPAVPQNVIVDQLVAVLAHEWAHIRNGDLRTLAGSRWLLVLLWPQPLYWVLRRWIRLDQETLADAAAATVAGRLQYAEQLVGWARSAARFPGRPRLAGAVGLWEGPSQLRRRVATLLDERLTFMRECPQRWRMDSVGAAMAATLVLSLVTWQRQTPRADAAEQAGAAGSTKIADGAEELATTGRQTIVLPKPDDRMAEMFGFRPRENSRPNEFSGRCIDGDDRALAGVSVAPYRGNPLSGVKEVVARTTTTERGQWKFESVVDPKQVFPNGEAPTMPDPNEPQIVCVAQQEGRVSCETACPQSWLYSKGRALDFIMPTAAILSGRVTDAQGSRS